MAIILLKRESNEPVFINYENSNKIVISEKYQYMLMFQPIDMLYPSLVEWFTKNLKGSWISNEEFFKEFQEVWLYLELEDDCMIVRSKYDS